MPRVTSDLVRNIDLHRYKSDNFIFETEHEPCITFNIVDAYCNVS